MHVNIPSLVLAAVIVACTPASALAQAAELRVKPGLTGGDGENSATWKSLLVEFPA
ncbi:MAG: hypothetical protein ABI281_11445 [Caldimonas sp.]